MNDSRPQKTRWYHLTPDRLLIGLFLAVGVLLLSERFCWFPFNEQRGLSMLIAIATVCGVFLVLLLWFVVSVVFRRRFQFSLRSLLVFVLSCAIVSSWFGLALKQARREQEIVKTFAKLGWSVAYDYELDNNVLQIPNAKPPSPEWLRELLGVDPFSRVVSVNCARGLAPEENMAYFSELTDLKSLGLSSTLVTDAGLEQHLKALTTLQVLLLQNTQVTDAGLEHLKGLTGLRRLWLNGTRVTDAGLEHLKGLTALYLLSLERTQVTDAGLEHLKGLPVLQELWLNGTQVTDAGLEHLKGLTALRWVLLDGTQVTDEGVNQLQQALPGCEIRH